MATRDIRTFHETIVCDMCGRTLLRGENAETYLAGGSRREVCDLCADRALHEGWIREDTRLERPEPVRPERGRSFLGRLRQRRDRTADRRGDRHSFEEPPVEPVAFDDEPLYEEPEPEPEPEAAPEPPPRRPRRRPPAPEVAEPREARQVRAVPTAPEQRVVAALEAFNQTEHIKTVAGVARSLGQPDVAARATGPGSRVTIVVSWELCWYRYEVELSEGGSGVHQAAQGYELSELDEADRTPTASADEYGQLHPAGA